MSDQSRLAPACPVCPMPAGGQCHGTWSRPTSPYDRVATVRETPSQMIPGWLVGRIPADPPADPPAPLSRRARARLRARTGA